MIHGGDVAGFVAEYGYEPLDFSANVNPLGTPDEVRRAVVDALDKADRYPDPLCRELRGAIAAQEGMREEQVLCGNGAADLIYRVVYARKPRRALVPAPTFSEYERALDAAGCAVQRYDLCADNGFAVDAGLLERIDGDLEMLFLCNPNNPTGVVIEPALIEQIQKRCAEKGMLLVIDECFNAFLDVPKRHSAVPAVRDNKDLLILKAFTKMYGMAGIRLGYAIGDPQLLDAMWRAGQPWAVSALAQAAGIAALRQTDFVAETRELVAAERAYLCRELTALGVQVVAGEANFLLFRARREDLYERLRQRGILVRDCANFPGLTKGYYRVAVRARTDNQTLIETLREVL